MLYFNITRNLIGLQDVILKNVEQNETSIYIIYVQLPRKAHTCPCCGKATDKVHDYRKQCIKDIPAFEKLTYIVLNKRRYICPSCKKRFYEKVDFVPRKHQSTKRLALYVIDELSNERSFSSVARETNLSVSTVIRRFDMVGFIRQIIWAFERVRKSEQKKYGKENRLLFKNSKRILTKRASKLDDEQKQCINAILYTSDALREAYILKEQFYEVCDCIDRASAKNLMEDWIYSAQESNLKDYHDCANTLLNWQKGILNSFEVPYTNGFTEGCNNKIKVLKRNAYGYRNFERFRKRILHMFRYKSEKAKTNAAA